MDIIIPFLLLLLIVAPFFSSYLGKLSKNGPGAFFSILPFSIFITLLFAYNNLEFDNYQLLNSSWGFLKSMEFCWRLDGLSVIIALTISAIGGFVLLYAHFYMSDYPERNNFLSFLTLSIGVSLGIVLTDNLMVMFFFWEMINISSFFLIGHHHKRKNIRKEARDTLLINAFGSLSLLFVILVIGQIAYTYSISLLLENNIHLGNHPYYSLLLILFLVAVLTKSTQFPFHNWLLKAMSAPAPANALLHSATFVNMGLFLLLRLHPILGGTMVWRYTLIAMGTISLIIGSTLALGQRHFKRILAYTTVSTLGLITLLIGIDTPTALKTALLLIILHSIYKSALFLIAGIVHKSSGTHKLYRLGRMIKHLPITAISAFLALILMAGLPSIMSVIGNEIIVEGKLHLPILTSIIIPTVIISNVFMVSISAILAIEVFLTKKRDYINIKFIYERDFPLLFIIIPLILSLCGFIIGIYPTLIETGLANALYFVQSRSTHSHIEFWEKMNEGIILSVITILFAALVIIFRKAISYYIFMITKKVKYFKFKKEDRW